MSLCRFLLLLIIALIVSPCRSVKVCDAMRCRRAVSAGSIRRGHRPLKFNEAPYLAIMLDTNSKPFCLGALVRLTYQRFEGRWTVGNVLVTTCTCAYRESHRYITFGNNIHDFQIDKLTKYHISDTLIPTDPSNKKCDIHNTYDSKDFAIMFSLEVEYPANSAYFKTKDMDMYGNYIDGLLEKHENECFGFGFGSYDFIHDTSAAFPREGKDGNILQVYDYRLITDDECEKYVPKCCGSWKDIGGKKGLKASRLHCAIRGRENSLCYGLIGSPIICDGYLLGFLKGHLKCSPDSTNYAGPDLFVPISHDFYAVSGVHLGFSWARPKPECLEDSVREFEIEEVYSKEDLGRNSTGGGVEGGGSDSSSSNKTEKKKQRDQEDYYYNIASNFVSHSFNALLSTTIALFII